MVSDTDQSAPSQKWSERQKDLFSQAFMYSMGTGGSLESFKKGVRILERQAEAGKVDACLLLGNLYSAQNGTVQNYELAIKWYRKGAARGDKDCQYFLAMKCLLGEGTQTDANKAVYWFRKAAKQGVVKAQSELGMLYYKGKGTGQNMTQAAKWLKKAAQAGNGEAQHKVGKLYFLGQGIPENYAKAEEWLKKAIKTAKKEENDLTEGWRSISEIAKRLRESGKDPSRLYRMLGYRTIADCQYMIGLINTPVRGRRGKTSEVIPSSTVAADWFYKACTNYLHVGNRERALESYELMKKMLGPRDRLVKRMWAQLYDRENTEVEKGSVRPEKIISRGTGWPVPRGYVVTNYHLIRGAEQISLLTPDADRVSAQVALKDKANDLALLVTSQPKKLPNALPLASHHANVGERVFTVGYPHPGIMGSEPKVTQGIVNSRTGVDNDPRTYQISAPMQGGNSGGPLLNMQGEVVGIALAKLNAGKVFEWTGDLPQSVGYAIKASYLRVLLQSMPQSENQTDVVSPVENASLEKLARRVRSSVVMVIARKLNKDKDR